MGTIKTKPTEDGTVSAKDVSMFTRIFNWLYKGLCAFAATIVRCKQKAEDAVSEAFMSLWEKALSFESVEKMRNWLYRATKFSSLNLARRKTYDLLTDNMIESLLTDEDGTHHMAKEAALDQIAVAVNNLDPQYKRIFKLAYIQAKSNDVIAKKLKLSYKTVANRKSEALTEIRAYLRAHRLSQT